MAFDWLGKTFKNYASFNYYVCTEYRLETYKPYERIRSVGFRNMLLFDVLDKKAIKKKDIIERINQNISERYGGCIPSRYFLKKWFDTVDTKWSCKYIKRTYILKKERTKEFLDTFLVTRLKKFGRTDIYLKDVLARKPIIHSYTVESTNHYYGKRLIIDVLDSKTKVAIECGNIIHSPMDKLECLRCLGYQPYWLKYDKILYKYENSELIPVHDFN